MMLKKLISLRSIASAALAIMSFPLTGRAFSPDPIPAPTTLNVFIIIDRLFVLFIWPVVVLIIILMFIMAGFKFLTAQGESSKINEARQALIWGVVGVAVIIISFSAIMIVRTVFGV